MMQAETYKEGDVLDYTAGSAMSGGDVVQADCGLAGVLVNDVAAGAIGSATVKGIFKVAAKELAMTAGQKIGWDEDGDPYGGTAGDGAATNVQADWDFELGVCVEDMASTGGQVKVKLNAEALGTTTLENSIPDPGDAGAIPVVESGSVSLVSAGGETRTLAAPTYAGQQLSLGFKTDLGDVVVTASAGVNQTGNNTLTFADAGDHLQLTGIELGAALVWRIVANDGVALSTV
jgi:predicted RecA/RadA family phage recombinase